VKIAGNIKVGIAIGIPIIGLIGIGWYVCHRCGRSTAEQTTPQDDRFMTLLRSTDPGERSVGALIAGQVAETEGLDPLAKALLENACGDPDSGVRTEAALALARGDGHEQYVAGCVRLFNEGKMQWSRMHLYSHIGMLARKENPELAPLLAEGLLEEDEFARAAAAWMIGKLPPAAIEELWTAATRATTAREFMRCMVCLTHLQDKAVPVALRELEGPRADLANKLLERIAGDAVQRTPAQWKAWHEARQGEVGDTEHTR